MSRNEYSFHAQRKPMVNPVADESSFKGRVKETILAQYDHLMRLKQSDQKIGHLARSQEKISLEITEAFNAFQKAADNDQIKQLNDKLNYLSTLHKKIKQEYDQIIEKELSVLHQNWPDIYDKIIEGIDRETLENVLTAYEQFKSGNISANQAVMNGMDYMTQKYHLPNDFFNKKAVEQFNQNIHKVV